MANATHSCNDNFGKGAQIPQNYPYREYLQIVRRQGSYTVEVTAPKKIDFGGADLKVPVDITKCNGTIVQASITVKAPRSVTNGTVPAVSFPSPFPAVAENGTTTLVPSSSPFSVVASNETVAPVPPPSPFLAKNETAMPEGGGAAFVDDRSLYLIMGVVLALLLLIAPLLLWLRRRRLTKKQPDVYSTPIRIADPENALRNLRNQTYAAVAADEDWDRGSADALLVQCTFDELKVFGDEGGHSQLSLSLASDDVPGKKSGKE